MTTLPGSGNSPRFGFRMEDCAVQKWSTTSSRRAGSRFRSAVCLWHCFCQKTIFPVGRSLFQCLRGGLFDDCIVGFSILVCAAFLLFVGRNGGNDLFIFSTSLFAVPQRRSVNVIIFAQSLRITKCSVEAPLAWRTRKLMKNQVRERELSQTIQQCVKFDLSSNQLW